MTLVTAKEQLTPVFIITRPLKLVHTRWRIRSLLQGKWQTIEQHYKIVHENVESDVKVSFMEVLI